MWPRSSTSVWTVPGATGWRSIAPSKMNWPDAGPVIVSVVAPAGMFSHSSVGWAGPVELVLIGHVYPPAEAVNVGPPAYFV
jgi:hypothetical protein